MMHDGMKQILITFRESTYRRLRDRAFIQDRTISSLVRQMVEQGLEGELLRKPTRITHFASVGAGRSSHSKLISISEKHDHAAAIAFAKRSRPQKKRRRSQDA